jgi:hypothetical protein
MWQRAAILLLVLLLLIPEVSAADYDGRRQVDLVVRTHHPDLALLLPLFRSFELFFPIELLGQFFVVLDEGSLDDAAMGLLMPSYVTVVYEPVAEIKTSLHRVHGVGPAAGYFNSAVSNFFVDKYGTSEFLGILDSDVVFRTGNVESLLFRGENPILFCSQHRDFAMDSVRRLSPAAFGHLHPFSCMESLPFVIRRDLLPSLRAFIGKQMGMDADPHAALVKLIEESNHIFSFGNFALMGSFAYVFERERYHFVIGGNGPLSTCPEIRPSIHVHYAGQNWRQHENQKLHPEYFDTVRKYMARGVCHMACSNQSEACAALVAQDPLDEELLSAEGLNEMMFGRLENLHKPHCLKHTVKRLKRHRKSLQKQACGLSKSKT